MSLERCGGLEVPRWMVLSLLGTFDGARLALNSIRTSIVSLDCYWSVIHTSVYVRFWRVHNLIRVLSFTDFT